MTKSRYRLSHPDTEMIHFSLEAVGKMRAIKIYSFFILVLLSESVHCSMYKLYNESDNPPFPFQAEKVDLGGCRGVELLLKFKKTYKKEALEHVYLLSNKRNDFYYPLEISNNSTVFCLPKEQANNARLMIVYGVAPCTGNIYELILELNTNKKFVNLTYDEEVARRGKK